MDYYELQESVLVLLSFDMNPARPQQGDFLTFEDSVGGRDSYHMLRCFLET